MQTEIPTHSETDAALLSELQESIREAFARHGDDLRQLANRLSALRDAYPETLAQEAFRAHADFFAEQCERLPDRAREDSRWPGLLACAQGMQGAGGGIPRQKTFRGGAGPMQREGEATWAYSRTVPAAPIPVASPKQQRQALRERLALEVIRAEQPDASFETQAISVRQLAQSGGALHEAVGRLADLAGELGADSEHPTALSTRSRQFAAEAREMLGHCLDAETAERAAAGCTFIFRQSLEKPYPGRT